MAGKRTPASELTLIRSIQRLLSSMSRPPSGLRLPLGDDAAAFRMGRGCLTLVSTDALVEGVHFDLKYFSPEDLGWKALAVNLSDIAAMGGHPRYFTTTLAVPPGTTLQFLRRLYRGMMDLARKAGVTLIGGDTCSSLGGLFLDVTILGEGKPENLLTREGARPGDAIFVSGSLGGSAMGLELLKRGKKPLRSARKVIGRHLRPMPRLKLAWHLAHRYRPTAMIDLSDGLSTDLGHLVRQSCQGAVIFAEKVPQTELPLKLSSLLPDSLLHYALNGGEDYELLFTVPARHRNRFPMEIEGIRITEIGCITSEKKGCWLSTRGKLKKLLPRGFDHFSKE